MATKEQYETGARNLTKMAREAPNSEEKAKILQYLGNTRYSQYKTTGEERARRLAANCYLAARNLRY